MTLRSLSTIAFLLSANAFAAPCPHRDSWPTSQWPRATAMPPMGKTAEVAALEDYAFTLSGTDAAREGLRTNSLLIISGGKMIYERYARGFDATKRHVAWSVGKSFTNALTGVAVAQGVVGLSDSICTWVKARPELCAATVQNLLEMSSGLAWQEGYENSSYQESSPISGLFGVGSRDIVGFALSHAMRYRPGEQFTYSTGEMSFLASLMNLAMTPKFGKDWPWSLLFTPLGMSDVVIQGDVKGGMHSGALIFATPNDFARFGFLYLNDGCWNSKRYLPEGWVTASTARPNAAYVNSVDSSDGEPPNGWAFWLNQPKRGETERVWKDAPPDAYAARGHWGQVIVVVPSRDVVIVRTGDDRKGRVDLNVLIPLALAVAP